MKKINLYNKILTILLCLVLFISSFLTISLYSVSATSYGPSNVLSDLQKDSSFNESDYPEITDSSNSKYKSLEVIHIAESENNELFIYTYQPAKSVLNFEVISIAMWTEFSSNGKDFTPLLYNLDLVSTTGVFSKYLVKGYTVEAKAERYYNISTIYRKRIAHIDTSIPGGETSQIAVSVGQQWCAYWYNDVLCYEMNTFETVEVFVKHNGHLVFENGLTLGNFVGNYSRGHLHYLAFDVENYIVSHIYDADVNFTQRDYTRTYPTFSGGDYSDPISTTVRLTDTDTAMFVGQGLFSKDYKWNKISSSTDFVNNIENQGIDFDESARNTILSSQWVFAFTETEYTITQSNILIEYGTEISDVTIVRLHFLDVNQKIYNLGAVCDKTTPDDIPDGSNPALPGLADIILKFDSDDGCAGQKILSFILFLIVAIILFKLLWPILGPVIGKIIVSIFKAIVWLITAPFKLIKQCVDKLKANKPPNDNE